MDLAGALLGEAAARGAAGAVALSVVRRRRGAVYTCLTCPRVNMYTCLHVHVSTCLLIFAYLCVCLQHCLRVVCHTLETNRSIEASYRVRTPPGGGGGERVHHERRAVPVRHGGACTRCIQSTHSLKGAWFQPLRPMKCNILVSKFAFKGSSCTATPRRGTARPPRASPPSTPSRARRTPRCGGGCTSTTS
jgi:hypothetical protein